MDTKTLNVGDRVLTGEHYGWHGQRHRPGTVTKRTPSGIITVTVDAYPSHKTVAHDLTFNPDGRERGKNYNGAWLDPFDQQVLDNEQRGALIESKRRFLEDYQLWREKLSGKAILQIAALVEAELAGEKKEAGQ